MENEASSVPTSLTCGSTGVVPYGATIIVPNSSTPELGPSKGDEHEMLQPSQDVVVAFCNLGVHEDIARKAQKRNQQATTVV